MVRYLFFFVIWATLSNLSVVASNHDPVKPKNKVANKLALHLYHQIGDNDLKFAAFEKAIIGYLDLHTSKKIKNERYLIIIDMSLSANKNRFFLIDVKSKKMIKKSKVAHGKNSGGEFAKYFSNKIGSNKSSIGFYKTAETYYGKHGLSLKLDGLENSNNNARKRAIVIHSADYVSDGFIKRNGRLGRSLGCPSLPKEGYNQIINTIKNGSVLFIYYPDKEYFNSSKLANSKLSDLINSTASALLN